MRILIALTLTGCAHLHPAKLEPLERTAVNAAAQGWLEAMGEPCHKLRTIGVEYAWAPCGNRNTADCVEMRGARQTIVVRDGQPLVDSQGGPIVHGAMHACEGSAGHEHLNPRVWIAKGGATSAQGRARSVLRAGAVP